MTRVSAVYTEEQDKEERKKDMIKTVKLMRSGKTEEDSDVCFRGLEHMQSTACMEQRTNNKQCVVDAVLDEQDQQWSTGYSDDAAIAKASTCTSQWAREKALQSGSSDEAYVRHIHLTR